MSWKISEVASDGGRNTGSSYLNGQVSIRGGYLIDTLALIGIGRPTIKISNVIESSVISYQSPPPTPPGSQTDY